jgi:predicted lipoprotein with Yx(FWY)xxD motif
MRKPLLIAAAAIALGAGCEATAAIAGPGRPVTTVVKSRSVLAMRVVVDSSGFTLYTWAYGRNGYVSAHNDPSYRPLIAHGQVIAAPGSKINGHMLWTRTLPNGQRQVTYHRQPLYLYNGDSKPGQANGEDKLSGNGAWLVVQYNGRPAPAPY